MQQWQGIPPCCTSLGARAAQDGTSRAGCGAALRPHAATLQQAGRQPEATAAGWLWQSLCSFVTQAAGLELAQSTLTLKQS